MDISQKIKDIPSTSGVYLMKNKAAQVIYIGKAVSLRKRIQSYFRKSPHDLPKTNKLVSEIEDIAVIRTDSEAEALILEASLIKRYRPKYNIELRDDKSFPSIEITKEKFPLIRVIRPQSQKRKKRAKVKAPSQYYGPYVSAGLIREALIIIRRIFPFRTCCPLPKKECLDAQMGLCEAPCAGKISVWDYAKDIRNVRLILEGKKDILYKNLMKDMERLARKKDFEEAAKVRDQIRAIGALYAGTKDMNYFKEAEQLQRALHLSRRPERIEAFDVSNLMGEQAVGSMVSFLNGRPDKNHYRRFRIRDVQGIDDFQMIAEIVRRRYRRLKNEKRMFPDLIIIDGGKGQLSSAQKTLDQEDIQIPIISLAKQQEEIFLPNRKQPLILPMDSLGLKLICRIRDEAHRFAIAYHRLLRKKEVIG
ncbi:MAG: excinuclease ABC subunit UvrC [Candidatus Omnitrophota bacterium]